DGVDADGAHELADERVADVELEVVGAPEVVSRLTDVDADDLGDVGILDQALDEQRAPPPSHAGDEDASLLRHERPVYVASERIRPRANGQQPPVCFRA